MSLLKQKLRRLAAGAGALSCATAALLAVGGLEAGSAQAACSTTFVGRGSALQRVAQTSVFEPAWEAGGCGTGANARVSYGTTTGSGLGEWGYLGSGFVNSEVPVIGSDVGPTAAQISNARSAGHGANTVIVPVTQTAIAVVVHPPSGCTLTQITNAHLDEAFSGKATTWAALGGSGTSCTSSVTRVVAGELAGDTYQFKNYLAKIRGWTESGGAIAETPPCTGSAKWSALESLSSGGSPNTSWPECGTIPVTNQMTGVAVAEKVAITAGTIGYAGLPDAKAKGAQTVNVQDGSSGGKPIYAGPVAGEEANCSRAKYTVPSTGLPASGTGLDVDWSQVFGGNPTIGSGYSICALTYDLGWHSYAVAGFGSAVGAQVKAYYEFILSHKLGTTPYYYANLPTGGGVAANNVQAAAEFAVSKIN